MPLPQLSPTRCNVLTHTPTQLSHYIITTEAPTGGKRCISMRSRLAPGRCRTPVLLCSILLLTAFSPPTASGFAVKSNFFPASTSTGASLVDSESTKFEDNPHSSRVSLKSALLEPTKTQTLRTTSIPRAKEASPKTAFPKYDWSFLDAVYLITCPNADPESLRLKKAKGVLLDLGLIDRVQIKEFATDDEDRIRGCYTSHISVMKDALNAIKKQKSGNVQNGSERQGWWQEFLPFQRDDESVVNGHNKSSSSGGAVAKIMVLEDNIEFSGNLRQSTLDSISALASQSTSWDMIHLSYIPYVPNLVVSRTDDESIVKLTCGIGSALGTTAYIINADGMERVVREDQERGYYAAIPDVMAKLFPETRYGAFPTPFLRAPNTNSLVNPQLDDLRALLFRPSIVSLAQRTLVLSGLSTNKILPLTVAALLIVTALAGNVSFKAGYDIMTTGTYEGNLLLSLLSTAFSFTSLLILAQGVALAPKPPPENPQAVESIEN